MKFKIRFADQIVGLVIILALASVAFVIVMLGQAQRWFAKDMDFTTVLSTAGGLSKNMAVQYKGFTIGNVKDFRLTNDDNVEVTFTIHEDYTKLAREGSIVELQIGFISLLGSQFVFHPGRVGQRELANNAEIPLAGSARANEYIRQNLATFSPSEDAIGRILAQVNTTLANVNPILADLGQALGQGTDDTMIGQMIGSLTTTVDGIPQILDDTIDGVLKTVLVEIRPIIGQVDGILAELKKPGGVLTMVDRDGDLYSGLVNSINSVSGIINSLDETVADTTAFLPSQFPQIAGLLFDLSITLTSVNDVLEALTNNPLLRGGITAPPQNQATGPRDIRF